MTRRKRDTLALHMHNIGVQRARESYAENPLALSDLLDVEDDARALFAYGAFGITTLGYIVSDLKSGLPKREQNAKKLVEQYARRAKAQIVFVPVGGAA